MIKTNRNEPCFCGSGKKYKKCCLYRGIEVQHADKFNKSEKILVKTLTNELFQPMRLYYEVYDKINLVRCLQQLKCIDYDLYLDDWTVRYEDEAGLIGLEVLPKDIPLEAQPLIISTIYIEDEETMLVDVRSIERAAKIIEFINKHVPREVAKITHAAIYNKLTTVKSSNTSETRDFDPDEIFNEGRMTVIDPEKKIEKMEAIRKQYKDKRDMQQAISQKLDEDAKQQLPEVEKFPVYYYEEGIKEFKTTCEFRQIIATKHFFGDTDYSFYDLVQELVQRLL